MAARGSRVRRHAGIATGIYPAGEDARAAIAAMGSSVEPLTGAIAETAAVLRAEHERLGLPDAIVLATAQHLHATLLTYDDRLSRIAKAK